MKQVFSSLIFLLLINSSYAQIQKPLINDTSYLSWTTADNGTLSPDGQYAFYRIDNEPKGGNTWVILATNKSWEYRSRRISNLNFSPDGKYLFAMQGDSLIKLRLHSNDFTTIPHCKHYELFSKEKSDWVIYTLNDEESSVVIQNLKTEKKEALNNIQEYSLNKNGVTVVSKLKPDGGQLETIQWTDINTGQSSIIYKGLPTKNLIYDLSGNRVAFDSTNERGQTEIWYYQKGWKSAKLIATDTTTGIAKDLKITTDETWTFSTDGEALFFNLTKKQGNLTKKVDEPDIWNYQDLFLLTQLKRNHSFLHNGENLSKLNIETGKILQLLKGSQKLKFPSFKSKNDNVLIVQSITDIGSEGSWNKKGWISYYLCFTKTGKIVPILENCKISPYPIELTPDNKYLLYFDLDLNKYLSYQVNTGATQIVGDNLKDELISEPVDARPGVRDYDGTGGIVGWIDETNKVVVKGKYDLWELDYTNATAPINLTGNVGKKSGTILSVFNTRQDQILERNKNWLLLGFNVATKENSIYTFDPENKNLKQLYRGTNYLFQPEYQIEEKILQKAEMENRYLFLAGNAAHSPNYLFTKDFKKFDTLSYVHPEKKYNWITSEVATYNDKFGNVCQGILYKPENFDSTKKYPIIFYYYLESSNSTNEHLKLTPSSIGINVPLLVSSGYIIFKPNIYYLAKKIPGESAVIGVLAAADYLGRFKWADTSKMGVYGHSYGGFETNYILTHSDRFKAGVSCAGVSNLIDQYNSWHEGVGASSQYFVKSICYLMGDGPESIQDDYVKNSPIMNSKDLSAPLLLMANDNDAPVNVLQSKYFFIQLRSLQKPVWLVQYNNEQHALIKKENRIDFQDKVKGFFDHYLKGTSIPDWMNHPITYENSY
jgi:dipeptidyl aminopeptidase/acylaminoacyl peptidase